MFGPGGVSLLCVEKSLTWMVAFFTSKVILPHRAFVGMVFGLLDMTSTVLRASMKLQSQN